MLVQVCWFFSHLVLVIFGIVTPVVSKKSFAQNTVDVFCFFDLLVFSHDQYVRFDKILFEAGCLAKKSVDDARMILR